MSCFANRRDHPASDEAVFPLLGSTSSWSPGLQQKSLTADLVHLQVPKESFEGRILYQTCMRGGETLLDGQTENSFGY